VNPASNVARVPGRFQRAIVLGLLQHLIVPRRLVVRMEQEMRVQVDEARRQRSACKIDAHRIGRRIERGDRADRGDGAVAHAHAPAVMRRVAVGRPDAVGKQHDVGRNRVRREKREGQRKNASRDAHEGGLCRRAFRGDPRRAN
jgi:hypothetical protein